MVRPTLFIADLHLSPARPQMTALFVRFLSEQARDAAALYILGDLFDVWIGDDDTDNLFNESVLAQIAALAERGTAVFFMHGNRDFMLWKAAATRARLRLLQDPTVIDLNGERTLLMHGDTLCTADHAYQRYRRIIQNPLVLAVGRHLLPLTTRRHMARNIRGRSEQERYLKKGAIGDVVDDAVVDAFKAYGVRQMIHGHTHRAARHELTILGETRIRWVLPDWYEQGGFLKASPEGVALQPLSSS